MGEIKGQLIMFGKLKEPEERRLYIFLFYCKCFQDCFNCFLVLGQIFIWITLHAVACF